jgi:glycerol-3-phosphate dehydrogenase
MRRDHAIDSLEQGGPLDLAVVGGGATGLGVALDAAARGYSVALVESHDFGAGTSSRATKLVHGGVRYLAQGRIGFVREALQERAYLLHNAPHLVRPLGFVMPSFRLWETPFHGAGLKVYDALAGSLGLGATRWLGVDEVLRRLPNLRSSGLKGGVLYWDAQFDDARLALALARTAQRHGAIVLNHCAATGLLHEGGRLAGLACKDVDGRQFNLRATCVINATGVWADALRSLDASSSGGEAPPLVAPSQGVHVVVDREFLAGRDALIIPRTEDGRGLFAVPWLGKVILGTTDTPRQDLPREPQPLPGELDFILRESGRYLSRAPRLSDLRSVWVGLRPLVRPSVDSSGGTAAASREHTVEVSGSGLVTVTGGKWTTYRSMAEDVLQRCVTAGLLKATSPGVTTRLRLVGADLPPDPAAISLAAPPGLHLYGSEAPAVQALPGASRMLGAGLTEAMVRFAVRREWARSVEDMLARRWRLLFLDAREAARLAPAVAAILADETGADPQLPAFLQLAEGYLPAAGA